jgi:hypothetical protein
VRRETPETEFTRRLRAELGAIVAERAADRAASESGSGAPPAAAWRRPGPRLAVAGAAVTAIVAAVLLFGAGGGDTPAAYAVKPHGKGMVSVEIHSLEDAKGLERALDKAGVPASVRYVGAGMTCTGDQPAPVRKAHGGGPGLINVAPVRHGGGAGLSRVRKVGPSAFLVDPGSLGPGLTLVVTASRGRGDKPHAVGLQVVEGKASPCKPVPAVGG